MQHTAMTAICCFNTQPPEGGWSKLFSHIKAAKLVSTHSRLKAAGVTISVSSCIYYGFNTQPPEGGWDTARTVAATVVAFQHTAA